MSKNIKQAFPSFVGRNSSFSATSLSLASSKPWPAINPRILSNSRALSVPSIQTQSRILPRHYKSYRAKLSFPRILPSTFQSWTTRRRLTANIPTEAISKPPLQQHRRNIHSDRHRKVATTTTTAAATTTRRKEEIGSFVRRRKWGLNPERSKSERQASRLVWMDCEMTGLNPAKDKVLEAACVVTDSNLCALDEGVEYVVKWDKEVLDGMNPWSKRQHQASGLTSACLSSPNSLHISKVDELLLEYVKKHIPQEGKAMMAGNSIHVDKSFVSSNLPLLASHLHYRVVDVSSIKEVAKRWYPDLLERVAKYERKQASKGELGSTGNPHSPEKGLGGEAKDKGSNITKEQTVADSSINSLTPTPTGTSPPQSTLPSVSARRILDFWDQDLVDNRRQEPSSTSTRRTPSSTSPLSRHPSRTVTTPSSSSSSTPKRVIQSPFAIRHNPRQDVEKDVEIAKKLKKAAEEEEQGGEVVQNGGDESERGGGGGNRLSPERTSNHRALDDLKGSIDELRFYRKYIFKDPKFITRQT